MPNATHKYHLYQQVIISPSRTLPAARISGVFEITRLMPSDVSGEPAYRIRSETAGERAAPESQLRPAS